jgi:hypothetical protein
MPAPLERTAPGLGKSADRLSQSVFDLFASPARTVFLSDPLRQHGGTSLHVGVVADCPDRRRKSVGSELLDGHWLGPCPRAVNRGPPEVLVALEGTDNRRTRRKQTGSRRSCASVMDDGSNVGEERSMGSGLDCHHVGVALDPTQRSPTARDHGPDAGLLHGVAHHGPQMGGIGPDTAAETDVDRRFARSQEALKVGIQKFRVRSPTRSQNPVASVSGGQSSGVCTRLGL